MWPGRHCMSIPEIKHDKCSLPTRVWNGQCSRWHQLHVPVCKSVCLPMLAHDKRKWRNWGNAHAQLGLHQLKLAQVLTCRMTSSMFVWSTYQLKPIAVFKNRNSAWFKILSMMIAWSPVFWFRTGWPVTPHNYSRLSCIGVLSALKLIVLRVRLQ